MNTTRPSLGIILLEIGAVIFGLTGLWLAYQSLGLEKPQPYQVAQLRNETWALRTIPEFQNLKPTSPLNKIRLGIAQNKEDLLEEGTQEMTKKIGSYSGKPLPLREAGEVARAILLLSQNFHYDHIQEVLNKLGDTILMEAGLPVPKEHPGSFPWETLNQVRNRINHQEITKAQGISGVDLFFVGRALSNLDLEEQGIKILSSIDYKTLSKEELDRYVAAGYYMNLPEDLASSSLEVQAYLKFRAQARKATP